MVLRVVSFIRPISDFKLTDIGRRYGQYQKCGYNCKTVCDGLVFNGVVLAQLSHPS